MCRRISPTANTCARTSSHCSAFTNKASAFRKLSSNRPWISNTTTRTTSRIVNLLSNPPSADHRPSSIVYRQPNKKAPIPEGTHAHRAHLFNCQHSLLPPQPQNRKKNLKEFFRVPLSLPS